MNEGSKDEAVILRGGGLSGLGAALFCILAIVFVGIFMPADPDKLGGWVERFPEIMNIRVIENLIYLAGLVMAVPLILAVQVALRPAKPAHALFGGAIALIGLVSMILSATPHAAHSSLSGIYASGEVSDSVLIGISWTAIWGVFNALLYVGFLITHTGMFLLILGMLGSTDWGRGRAVILLILAALGFAAGIGQLILPASPLGAVSYFAMIIQFLILGLKLRKENI